MSVSDVDSRSGKRVAIIGSGCAGIAALWALKNSPHEVYIYEAADRLGGHTNTVVWKTDSLETNVDTGFIVMNAATYPNFLDFLRHVRVQTMPTEMTFSVSRDHGALEWAGTSLRSIFCQGRNLFSPRMWRMLFDIIRFNQFALDVLAADSGVIGPSRDSHSYSNAQESIGDYLHREGYSAAFRDDYLIPMTAAVWSTSPDKCSLQFPAVTLIRFMWNHHLLSTVMRRPSWLTIPGGSKSYIDAVMEGFPPERLFLNAAVRRLTNEKDGRVCVQLSSGRRDVFDHVILATHGDQAYSIIQDSATHEEREIMSRFRTSANTVVLHSDTSLMPKARAAWCSWNYLTKSCPLTGKSNIDQVSLTYNMNILQHIPRTTFGDVLVTLNPLDQPDPRTVQGWFQYEHPLYTAEAIRSQMLLPSIQNKRGISYAGAWTKYGFHEDGFTSGLRVAQEHLGAMIPFEIRDSTFSRGQRPVLKLGDRVLRLWILGIQLLFVGLVDNLLRWFAINSERSRRDVNRGREANRRHTLREE